MLVVRHTSIYGFCRPLEGNRRVADVRQRGFGLIEMMIGIAIVSMTLVWGLPSFTLWLQGTHNRTAAESIQNGLQLARTEAVKRNAAVRFNLTDAGGAVAWNVGCVTVKADCPATIQSRPAIDGSVNARAGASTAAIPNPPPLNHFNAAIAAGTGLPGGVSFDGIGRVPGANIGTDITRIDITNAATPSSRRLVVTIGTGGEVRMCDPAVAISVNPQGCA